MFLGITRYWYSPQQATSLFSALQFTISLLSESRRLSVKGREKWSCLDLGFFSDWYIHYLDKITHHQNREMKHLNIYTEGRGSGTSPQSVHMLNRLVFWWLKAKANQRNVVEGSSHLRRLIRWRTIRLALRRKWSCISRHVTWFGKSFHPISHSFLPALSQIHQRRSQKKTAIRSAKWLSTSTGVSKTTSTGR